MTKLIECDLNHHYRTYNRNPADSTRSLSDKGQVVRKRSLLEILVLDRRDGIDIILESLKQFRECILVCRFLAESSRTDQPTETRVKLLDDFRLVCT